MNTYHLFYLVLFISIFTQNLLGQNTKYRKTYLQAWEQRPDFEHQIDSAFLGEDAVILSEFTEWSLNNRFNSTLVTTHRRVIILTTQGITTGSRVNIPEVIDPTSEYSDISVDERGGIYRPKYFDLEINFFKARILKPNGQLKIVSPKDVIQEEQFRYNNRDRIAYSYHFTIPEVEAGDIVEISYSWYLPFVFDWKRFFLHNLLPIQSRVFQLTVPARELTLLHLHNGMLPPDTLKSPKAPDFNHTYVWNMNRLPACLYEPNARLHADLPHITYYLHNKAYGVLKNDEFVQFLPYTWTYFSYDMVSFRHIKTHKTKRLLSSKEIVLNNFFADQTYGIGKEYPYMRIAKIQNTLAEDFKYFYEKDPFSTTDERMSKLKSSHREIILKEMDKNLHFQGPFDRLSNVLFTEVLTEGYLGLTDAKREKVAQCFWNNYLLNINRYVVYEGLLTRMKEDFYRVLVADKRIGQIKADTCLPVFGQELIYSVKCKNELAFVYPKNRRFGYQVNELPFYLENTPSLHIWQMADSHLNPKVVQVYPTPGSETLQNYRTTNVKVQVNLQTKQLLFESKLALSGQFSTLIRGFYQYNSIDSTVNPRYYRHFAKLSDATQITSKPEINVQSDYPFKADIRLQYTDNTLITQPNNSTYQINLSNWIQHILADGFNAQKRTLPFYPDFKGTDTYNYYLEFDRDVRIEGFKDLPLTVDNEFGIYTFDIKQPNPHTMIIQSSFKTIADRLEANQVNLIAQIYNYVKQLENASLTVVATSNPNK